MLDLLDYNFYGSLLGIDWISVVVVGCYLISGWILLCQVDEFSDASVTIEVWHTTFVIVICVVVYAGA